MQNQTIWISKIPIQNIDWYTDLRDSGSDLKCICRQPVTICVWGYELNIFHDQGHGPLPNLPRWTHLNYKSTRVFSYIQTGFYQTFPSRRTVFTIHPYILLYTNLLGCPDIQNHLARVHNYKSLTATRASFYPSPLPP